MRYFTGILIIPHRRGRTHRVRAVTTERRERPEIGIFEFVITLALISTVGRIAHREALEGILSDEQRSQMREFRTRVNRGQRARRPSGLREASGHAYAAEL